MTSPLLVGLTVFSIILLSGLALLIYIALTMRFSKRNQKLWAGYLQTRFDHYDQLAEKVFKHMTPIMVEAVRAETNPTRRLDKLTAEVSSYIVAHDGGKLEDTGNVSNVLLYAHFGGYRVPRLENE